MLAFLLMWKTTLTLPREQDSGTMRLLVLWLCVFALLPYLATQLFGLAFCEPLPPVPPIVPEFSIFGKLLNRVPAAI